jgi:stage V sporulation protein S
MVEANNIIQSVPSVNSTPATRPYVKVAATSRPPSVAGAIAGFVRDNGSAEVQAIGAAAVNQAVKALAIARLYLQKEGIDVVCNIQFLDIIVNGEERTAMHFQVGPRKSAPN